MATAVLNSRLPRIVHLNHTGAHGGAEMALVRMLSVAPEWQAEVLLPPVQGENIFDTLPLSIPRAATGVRQEAGGSSRSPVRMLGLGARLIAQAAATRGHRMVRRSDLVVANSTRAAAYAALALQGSRKPFVVHVRDMVEAEAIGPFGYRMMTRVVLPRADGVIADTRSALDTARPYLRADALAEAIPSAFGLRRGLPSARGTGPLRIGMLARIDPWKGQSLLLEAFAQAFPDGDERLELVGGSPFQHDEFMVRLRDRVVELGLAGRVVLPGHVTAIDPLLSGWDIAVQASLRSEPLGQNVLQYLASGVATIVADEGGPREWVRDDVNGLRVPPRDERALAAALRALADDPVRRRRLGDAGPLTAGLLDDREAMQAHAELYRDVVRRARGIA